MYNFQSVGDASSSAWSMVMELMVPCVLQATGTMSKWYLRAVIKGTVNFKSLAFFTALSAA